MALFSNFTGFLKKAVGNNMTNKAADVRTFTQKFFGHRQIAVILRWSLRCNTGR